MTLPLVGQAVSLLEEVITPRKELPPLLLKLSERRAERLDYLGVSYGLTTQLLKYVSIRLEKQTGGKYFYRKSKTFFLVLPPARFWKKAGYTPVYLRQTPVSINKQTNKPILQCLCML